TRPGYPSSQGHLRLPGRAQTLRRPGRSHDRRRRYPARLERGRKARLPSRLHRQEPRPCRTGNRLRRVRGVTAQVYENGRRLAIGAGATSVHWVGGEALFTLSDGNVFVAAQEGDTRRIAAHGGVILCATLHPDGKRLVTGGDDGAIKAISPDGEFATLAEVRKWVDHLVSNAASGVVVAGVGKDAIVFKGDQEPHRFTHPSTIGGIARDSKGRRLAVSHYGGVTMRLVLAADDRGNALKWA